MKKKTKIIVGGSIVLVALVLGIHLNLNHSERWNMIMANVEALAQGEGAGSECPNGGYWSTGNRSEDKDFYWEKIEISTGISLGLFKKEGSAEAGINWVRVETVAYFCDGKTSGTCLVCNRYKL